MRKRVSLLFSSPFKGEAGRGVGLPLGPETNPFPPGVAGLGHPGLAGQPGPSHPASGAHRRASESFANAPNRPLEGEGFGAPARSGVRA